jgi:hypothetical protein
LFVQTEAIVIAFDLLNDLAGLKLIEAYALRRSVRCRPSRRETDRSHRRVNVLRRRLV